MTPRESMEPDFYESRRISRRPKKRSESPENEELFQEAPDIARISPRTPYQKGSETSREAAERALPKAAAMAENIYLAIVAAGPDGLTRKELESITGYLTQTLCPRLYDLEEDKRIRKLTRLSDDRQKIETVKRDGCVAYVLNREFNAQA